MPEWGTYGSVRGVPGNGHPYRDKPDGAFGASGPAWPLARPDPQQPVADLRVYGGSILEPEIRPGR